MIRRQPIKYLPHVGLTQANVNITTVLGGPEAIKSAQKYGLSEEDVTNISASGSKRIFDRLSEVAEIHQNGRRSLAELGSNTDDLSVRSRAKHIEDLRAAAFMYGGMGESKVAMLYFGVADKLSRGKSVRYEAASTFWITEFASALGDGEAAFASVAWALLEPLATLNTGDTLNDRTAMHEWAKGSIDNAPPKTFVGLLQPKALNRLIVDLKIDDPTNKMLPAVEALSQYVYDAYTDRLPQKYTQLERWKAEVKGDLDESANIAFVQIEHRSAWEGWRRSSPTRNIGNDFVRHFINNQRRFAAPLEAATAAPFSWMSAVSKFIAAADAQDINIEERKRLAAEGLKLFRDPWDTIIRGDRPQQTWGELFGKKGESIAMVGEWMEKAGSKIAHGDPAQGYMYMKYGKALQKHAPVIAPWAETGVFIAATMGAEAPAAASGIRTAGRIAGIAPLIGSTPESSWPMFGIMAGRGALSARIPQKVPVLGGMGLPHFDPATGNLVTHFGVAQRFQTAAGKISMVGRTIHPAPRIGLDLWGMHKLGSAQYEQPEPVPNPDVEQF